MASPDNSTVPPLTQITDAFGQLWAIEPVTNHILLNGVWANNGIGSIILYVNQTIYVFGTDNNWWKWDINSIPANWVNVGQQKPGPIPVNLQVVIIRCKDLQNNLNLYENKIKYIIHAEEQCGIGILTDQMILVIDMN